MLSPRSTASPIAFTALSALFSAGCSSSVGVSDAGAASVYVPEPSDFCGYTSWTSYDEPDAGGDGIFAPSTTTDGGFIHVAGGRIEYLNHTPPHGSTQFPVGTIIVKVIPAQDQIFAMAKVGGGYNPNGPGGVALNWQWFELLPGACPDGWIWDGYEPPANQAYGGMPQACNDCHGGFPQNDYVASPKILLKDY
jgi:hypothetical protein